MVTPLMTLAEMREHVETGKSDAALARVMANAEQDIHRHVGDAFQVDFADVIFRAAFQRRSAQAEPDIDAIVTVGPNRLSGERGTAIVFQDFGRVNPFATVGFFILGSHSHDGNGVVTLFNRGGIAYEQSIYITHRTVTVELPYGDPGSDGERIYFGRAPNDLPLINEETDLIAAWTIPIDTDPEDVTTQSHFPFRHLVNVLDAIRVVGERFTMTIAAPGAAVPLPIDVTREQDKRRDALIDLVALAVKDNPALATERVGPYSAEFRNKDQARNEILQRLILASGDLIV